MKHKLISLLIGLLLLGLLLIGSSCVPTSVTGRDSQGSSVLISSNNVPLQRYVDEEAGVVCWYFYEGGISCLPIGQTCLAEPPW